MTISQLARIAAITAAACAASACVKIPGMPTGGMPGVPGVQPGQGGATATSAGGEAYETATVPGSPQQNAGVIRINVATGQTVTAFGAPSQMVTIPDPPIPTGVYHVTVWSQPANSDGSISWGASRVEKTSGRIWILNGGGSSPYTWIELTPPSK
jgi:hypothetical protein